MNRYMIQSGTYNTKHFLRFVRGAADILSSARLRIFLLRILLVSTIFCLFTASFSASDLNLGDLLYIIIISSVIFVHHCSSVFVLKWMPIALDTTMTVAELVTTLVLVRPWTWWIDPFHLGPLMTLVIAIYVQASSLGVLLVIRMVLLMIKEDSTSSNLLAPFDFLKNTSSRHKHHRRSIIAGFSIWRKTFSNEPRFIFLSRGICAIATVIAAVGFFLVNLVIEPVQEIGRVPQKLYRSTDFPREFGLETDLTWRIIAFTVPGIGAVPSASGDDNVLHEAVTVDPIWGASTYEWENPGHSDIPGPMCAHSPGAISKAEQGRYRTAHYPSITAIVVTCPDRYNWDPKQVNAFDYINFPSREIWPDLLITVNFTTLGVNGGYLDEISGQSVSIVPSLTKDSLEALAITSSIPLIPDIHLIGPVALAVRQRSKETGFATLGFSTGVDRYLSAHVPYLMSDPSPYILRYNNTATLRLFMQNDYSDWSFIAEYREKSVWAGLSAAGGFWTTLNGVFTIIFGTSLMMSLFGIKPLSIFGLLHMLPFSGPDKDYPSVLPQVQSDDGFAGYVSHHFIQLPAAENASTDPETISLRSRHNSFSEATVLERRGSLNV